MIEYLESLRDETDNVYKKRAYDRAIKAVKEGTTDYGPSIAKKIGEYREFGEIGTKPDQPKKLHRIYVEDTVKAMGMKNYVIAGSYRRNAEYVGDIDVICLDSRRPVLLDVISEGPEQIAGWVEVVGTVGTTHGTTGKVRCDVRFCSAEDFPAMLLYFTGSKEFNIRQRGIAKKKGFKLNQHGLYRGTEKLKVRSERDIFKILEMPYLEPEMRV